MTEFSRTGFTSIKAGDRHYWFPFLPAENDKIKVLLPTGESDFTLIDSVDDLINWFFKAFPNAVMEARKIKEIVSESEPAEVKDIRCPKCGCKDLIKNGFNLKRERRYLCKHCHKTFVPAPDSASYDPINT